MKKYEHDKCEHEGNESILFYGDCEHESLLTVK